MSKDVSEDLRLAAVDIGTNSVRLLIIQFEQGNLKTISRRVKITRLGEKVNQNKTLADGAISRTITVLREYQREIEAKKVQGVRVATTSAAREAKNVGRFLARLRRETGFEVDILSGKEEAQLAFLGVTSDHELRTTNGLLLVIDIGGGSTELILGRGRSLEKLYSLDIGCVRLTEMFLKTDPPTAEEIKQAKDYIRRIIKNVILEIKHLRIMNHESRIMIIGVAGTITTLVAVKKKMKVYDSSKIHGSKLTKSDITKILELFLSKPLGERKKIVGLEPARADIIIAGVLILQEILSCLGVKEIVISEHDILDGLILSQIPGRIS